MESHDSYPVFHTRLLHTQRRQLTRRDGTSMGWLIINAVDQLTDVARRNTDGPDDPPKPRSRSRADHTP